MGVKRRRWRRWGSPPRGFWRQEYGGMPMWGIVGAGAFLILAAAIAITSMPQQVSAGARYTPPPSAQTTTPTPESATAPVVAFVGDSYTSGVGSTEPALGWPKVAAQINGWDARVFAQGGTGYQNGAPDANYAARLQAIVDANPAAVIVAGGRNDLAFTAEEVGAAATDFLAALRAALPGVPVYVVNPWWDDDAPPAEFAAVSDALRAAAESTGVVYVDTGQPLLERADLLTSDGVHPNNAGHAALAEAVAARITVG